MPLNEHYDPIRSKLTPQQKAEMTAETLGVRDIHMEQSENITDLNKPPQKPYKYEPFPKTVYYKPKPGQHPHEASKVIQDQAELDKALELGYQLKAFEEALISDDLEADAPNKPAKKK
jgi:hypothetical protein